VPGGTLAWGNAQVKRNFRLFTSVKRGDDMTGSATNRDAIHYSFAVMSDDGIVFLKEGIP
jgi:hypothetical protein